MKNYTKDLGRYFKGNIWMVISIEKDAQQHQLLYNANQTTL